MREKGGMAQPDDELNIGPGQRKLRYGFAVAGLAASLALGIYLFATHAERPWRWLMFIPLSTMVTAYLEGKEKTCIVLAATGQCSLDERFQGERAMQGTKIADAGLVSRLRRRAVVLTLKAQAIAAALTAGVYFLPG
ncbi:MAG: hypothetical protein M5U26_14295 [Planctomycetota bacterium]|nr:hypothetical protein [Planctomycetota bacterium]